MSKYKRTADGKALPKLVVLTPDQVQHVAGGFLWRLPPPPPPSSPVRYPPPAATGSAQLAWLSPTVQSEVLGRRLI